MRHLFIVFSKLLGILAFYWALIIIPQITFTMAVYQSPASESQIPPSVALSSMLVAFVASLFLGILLLFKTETIATFLRIPADTEITPAPSDALLQTGIILIGIYILVIALPEFLRFLTEILMKFDRRLPYDMRIELRNSYTIGRFLSLVLKISMAICLVICSKHVVRLITKYQRT